MDDLDDPDLKQLLAAIEEPPLRGPLETRASDPVIPEGLVAFVRTICRAEWVAAMVLTQAAKKVQRRIRHDIPEARRARWAKRWLPENQARTKRWLGQVRDRVLREHHQIHVHLHGVPTEQPEASWKAEPDESGSLVIDDPIDATHSFGDPSYLEQTPVPLLAWVHQRWLEHSGGGLGDNGGLVDAKKPRVWDLTSGSGTASDYFGALCGCDVVSTDLVNPATGTIMADCRNLGRPPEHGGKIRFGRPDLIIRRPDIILIDPPSPGLPLHSEVYGKEADRCDLGALTREHWIIAVADVAVRATQHLAEDGFVSLLLRCGVRLNGQAIPDPAVLGDFKAVLGDRATIAHEMPLVFRRVRNQLSLGAARLPAVHLVLTRSR